VPRPVTTPARRALSACAGWLADRRIPTPLRRAVFGAYCAATGADAGEAQLAPAGYASLNAFFLRRLKEGARVFDPDPAVLPSPCDGRLQAAGMVTAERILQAKGVDYSVRELLSGADGGADLEGALAFTLYLSPRDYHRVHAPLAGLLEEVRWVPGARFSVAPRVAARLGGLFALNERAVLRFADERGPFFLVMVGALNVGRIRVVGVAPGASPSPPRPVRRGEEIARFEMGSTVVLVMPRAHGLAAEPLEPGAPVRLGQALARRR
jgi:phosphatidylserine decarboxylase